MTGDTQLTIGGLAIALAVLWANLRPWWKGGRAPKDLIPFGSGFGLGALSTICAGGLLGWLAGCSAGVTNTLGEKAVPGATGTQSSALSKGSLGNLTPEGGAVVFLLTIALVIAWKAAGKLDKRRMFGGLVCGSTLCLTVGVAGLLAWLPQTINAIGQYGRTAIEGGGLL